MSGSTLTRDEILTALGALSDRLGEIGILGEICLFGGAVLLLAFNVRVTTKDVDAVFTSSRADITAGNLPQFPYLRLTMPVPEYLLAMKCMAARIGATEGDASDVLETQFLVEGLFEEGRI